MRINGELSGEIRQGERHMLWFEGVREEFAVKVHVLLQIVNWKDHCQKFRPTLCGGLIREELDVLMDRARRENEVLISATGTGSTKGVLWIHYELCNCVCGRPSV